MNNEYIDNQNKINNNLNLNIMFKIVLESTWNKNGIPTNYIKYMGGKDLKIEEVINYYGLDRIKEVIEL